MSLENKNKQPNIYDLGYDKNLNLKEVVKEQELAFQQRTKERKDEQVHRESLRIQRVSVSGENPIVYAVDKIIEKCLISKDRVEIDLSSLGFEENISELGNAHRFLNKLKKAKCFENVERSSNTLFVITKPNIKNLKKCRDKFRNQFQKKVKVNYWNKCIIKIIIGTIITVISDLIIAYVIFKLGWN